MTARPDGERLHPRTAMARGWVLLLILLWQAVRQIDFDAETLSLTFPEGWEAILLGALAVLYLLVAVVGGLGAARHTRFRLAERRLEVETGWLSHTSQTIPYGAIHAVNVSRPFSARMLRLARLRVEAGQDETVTFEYLGWRRAEELRDELLELSRRAHVERSFSVDDLSDDGAPAVPSDREIPGADEGDVLVTVPPERVARARLRSFVPLFIVCVLAIAIPVTIARELPGVLIGIGLAAVAGLARWVWTIVSPGTVVLRRRGDSLTVTEGRFDTNVTTAAVRRVYSIEVTQPVLWRKPGLYTLTLNVMGDVDTDGEGFSLRAVTHDEVQAVIGAVRPGANLDALLTRRLSPRARGRYPFAARNMLWGHDRELLAIRRGAFRRSWSLVPLARLQAVTVDAGPLVRRRDLASLNLWMPEFLGLEIIPGLDRAEALDALEDLTRIAAKVAGPPANAESGAP